jgi:predicted nucleic acid-binding protein
VIYLVDTNVALRLVSKIDARHQECLDAVADLKTQGNDLCVSLQVAVELWNVVTRPKTSVPAGLYGLSVQEATNTLTRIESQLLVTPDPPKLYETWRDLVFTHNVVGAKVHDARHAAWVIAHGMTGILTYNRKDFVRYPGLAVISPDDLS